MDPNATVTLPPKKRRGRPSTSAGAKNTQNVPNGGIITVNTRLSMGQLKRSAVGASTTNVKAHGDKANNSPLKNTTKSKKKLTDIQSTSVDATALVSAPVLPPSPRPLSSTPFINCPQVSTVSPPPLPPRTTCIFRTNVPKANVNREQQAPLYEE